MVYDIQGGGGIFPNGRAIVLQNRMGVAGRGGGKKKVDESHKKGLKRKNILEKAKWATTRPRG